MANGYTGFLIILLVLLAIVVIFFAILDKLMKGGGKKAPAKKTAAVKPTATPAEKVAKEQPATKETKTPPTMKIYNSELADDLNKILKESKTTDQSLRLQIENHLNKESNISKYIQNKNYHGFNFAEDDTMDAEEIDTSLTFTSEDYKRIMALSNIDDKKSL